MIQTQFQKPGMQKSNLFSATVSKQMHVTKCGQVTWLLSMRIIDYELDKEIYPSNTVLPIILF